MKLKQLNGLIETTAGGGVGVKKKHATSQKRNCPVTAHETRNTSIRPKKNEEKTRRPNKCEKRQKQNPAKSLRDYPRNIRATSAGHDCFGQKSL